MDGRKRERGGGRERTKVLMDSKYRREGERIGVVAVRGYKKRNRDGCH
jgi:hypothetical protein